MQGLVCIPATNNPEACRYIYSVLKLYFLLQKKLKRKRVHVSGLVKQYGCATISADRKVTSSPGRKGP
jgi:hypothetical protein